MNGVWRIIYDTVQFLMRLTFPHSESDIPAAANNNYN